MEKKTIPCICGKSAEMRRLPIHGVYIIQCECGRCTGADTETSAMMYWNKLIGKGEEQ